MANPVVAFGALLHLASTWNPLQADLLAGSKEFTATIALEIKTESAVENAIPPTFDVNVTLDRPLIDASVLASSSLFTVTPTVYSVPDTKVRPLENDNNMTT